MEFEWDEVKRQINFTKHGIEFDAVRALFEGRPFIERQSPLLNEDRWIRTGIIEERFVTVVWTKRGNVVRIISARSARHGERRAYRAIYG